MRWRAQRCGGGDGGAKAHDKAHRRSGTGSLSQEHCVSLLYLPDTCPRKHSIKWRRRVTALADALTCQP